MRDSLAELLTDDDIVVTKAQNGQEGLRLLKINHFDLVISDLFLPQMDGKEMLLQARACGIFTPIIFFTSQKFLKIDGAIAVVQRPYFERLSIEVNSVLNKSQFMCSQDNQSYFYKRH